jgi:hypothetical protein
MVAAPMAKDLSIEAPPVFAAFSFALVIFLHSLGRTPVDASTAGQTTRADGDKPNLRRRFELLVWHSVLLAIMLCWLRHHSGLALSTCWRPSMDREAHFG